MQSLTWQDRSFKPDGSLAYPDAPFTAPRVFNYNLGNVLMSNGVVWPKMLVERRKYRFRLLNGCNSRVLSLRFISQAATNPSTLTVWQIGTDGGMLNSPVDLTNANLIMAPAERMDIIVDFGQAGVAENFILTNSAPAPYPYGTAPAPGSGIGSVILFKAKKPFNTAMPDALAPPPVLRHKPFVMPTNLSSLLVRKIVAYDVLDMKMNRIRRELGTDDGGAMSFVDKAGITETPLLNSMEIWEFYNPTGETHPLHMHQTMFRVISRHDISYTNGRHYVGPTSLTVLDNERGAKDTVRVDPSTVVRVLAYFDLPGLYVYHCHTLEHEDYDMMRPMCVGGNCDTAWEDMSTMPW